MLKDSEADFSSEDDADETYIPFNINVVAEERDENSCD